MKWSIETSNYIDNPALIKVWTYILRSWGEAGKKKWCVNSISRMNDFMPCSRYSCATQESVFFLEGDNGKSSYITPMATL